MGSIVSTQSGAPITVPWAEVTPRGGMSASDGSWGSGNTRHTMVIDCFFDDLPAFIPGLLGRSACYDTTRLTRTPPMAHPRWPYMFATAITSAKYYKPVGKVTGPFGSYARFKYARLTVLFEVPDYKIISDQALAAYTGRTTCPEFFRNTVITTEPAGEAIVRNTGDFTYVEGATPPNTTPFPGFTNQILSKPTMQVVWKDVPAGAVLDFNGQPTNIIAALGKVNDSIAFPSSSNPITVGTLLFDACKIVRKVSPIDPLTFSAAELSPGNASAGVSTFPQILLDITFMLKKFDPPVGAGATTHGHNLAPWVTNGKWYLVRSGQDGTGDTIYGTSDFNKLFQPIAGVN